MKRFVHEIHRRSLWQVLGLYLAGSWVALQVVEQLAEAAALPDWVHPFSLVLLILGFPIVMATAFVQEGVRRDPRAGAAGDGEGAEPVDAAPNDAGGEAARPEAARREAPRWAHGVLTWRNAIIGGVLAFALLGLGTLGYMAMRTLGVGPAGTLVAKGLLEERAPIIVADFESTADDPNLAYAATLALRTDLAQSRVVTVLEPVEIAEVLQRMQRSADEPLTPELARNAAVREGIPAVVAGEITSAGGAFVVSARLLSAASGEVLVSERARASDEGSLLDAIDGLSDALRARIGESFATLRAEAPLETVTTASLPALQKYSEAMRAIEAEGQPERGVALLEEAVTLDPEFAMAWRKLGVELGNRQEDAARRVEAMTRAFDLRDRLTAPERYLTMASYFTYVTNEADKAITAYENLLEIDPTDDAALNNLGGAYGQLRDQVRAEEYYLAAASADSSNSIPFTNAVSTQIILGKLGAADTMQRRSERLFPTDPWVAETGAALQTSGGDDAAADATIEALRATLVGNLFWRSRTSGFLAALAAKRGRLAVAEDELRQAANTDRQRGLPGEVLEREVFAASLDLWIRDAPGRALARLERALVEQPLEEVDPLDRPYVELIVAYAMAGRAERGRALLAELERVLPEEARRGLEWDVLRARGVLALAEGDAEEAIDLLRRSDRGPCILCSPPFIALALDRAGRTEEAIDAYLAYDEQLTVEKVFFDALHAGRMYERLGELYDGRGDLENATKYYAKFVDLWAGADEELQPRVRAAQARLEEIVRAHG